MKRYTDMDEALSRKTARWKRELLDTSKRNRMINYRETSRATLRILEPDAATLFNKLAFSEKPLTFQKPINKDTDLRTYSMIALTLSGNGVKFVVWKDAFQMKILT